MHRDLIPAVLCLTFLLPGCGGDAGSQPGADNGQRSGTPSDTSSSELVAASSPVAVVSQFLDRIRRGGDNGAAESLLTAPAQAVLAEIGRTLQPMGSPNSTFTVTRSSAVPGHPGAALVHSIWTEAGGPETSRIEVVWAVEREGEDWRISGMAIETTPGTAPTVMDFENPELMARMLGDGAGVRR